MYQARKYLNKKSLVGLYNSYIYPYLIYCVESWGNIALTILTKQTSVFHLSTHFFAVSLNLLRSSNEQGCARRVQLHHLCSVLCCQIALTSRISFVVPPFLSLFLATCESLYVVDSGISASSYGLSHPLAKLSFRLIVALCGIACSLQSHDDALHRITLGEKSAGFTLRKKQFRDFSLLSAGF